MVLWFRNLYKDLPKRVGRVAGALRALSGIRRRDTFVNGVLALACFVFDIFGGPEILQAILRRLTNTRRLSTLEQKAALLVFGHQPLRYGDVRISTGGILDPVHQLNKNRAFAAWHTICLPSERVNELPLLIHELTHVYQYERVGSIYILQGLSVQIKHGRGAYDYGDFRGLQTRRAAGKSLRDYNREQQAQIAQDYYRHLVRGNEVEAYLPYIEELRNGLV